MSLLHTRFPDGEMEAQSGDIIAKGYDAGTDGTEFWTQESDNHRVLNCSQGRRAHYLKTATAGFIRHTELRLTALTCAVREGRNPDTLLRSIGGADVLAVEKFPGCTTVTGMP